MTRIGNLFDIFMEGQTTPFLIGETTAHLAPSIQTTNATNRSICGTFLDADIEINPSLLDDQKKDSLETVLFVIYLVIGLLSVLGNMLVILSIGLVHDLRKPTNYFIASLAVSDLFIGVGILVDCALFPFWSSLCGQAYEICISLTTINNIAMAVSPLNLMAIAYDRYKYITDPLRYYQTMTNTKVVTMVTVIWVYSFVLAMIPIFPGNITSVPQQASEHVSCLVYKVYPKMYLFFLIYGHLYVAFFVTCLFYAQIFKKAFEHTRNIEVLRRESTGSDNSRRRHQFLNSAAWRVTKMSAIVIVSVFVLWCPHTSLVTYLILCNDCTVHYSVYTVTYTLFYLNSCNNTFIYAWRSVEFRKAFKHVLQCKCRH